MRMAPENTIAAFEKAAAVGADFVELAVRVDRTTNGLTLREIRRLRPSVPAFADALRWGKRRGVRIDAVQFAARLPGVDTMPKDVGEVPAAAEPAFVPACARITRIGLPGSVRTGKKHMMEVVSYEPLFPLDIDSFVDCRRAGACSGA